MVYVEIDFNTCEHCGHELESDDMFNSWLCDCYCECRLLKEDCEECYNEEKPMGLRKIEVWIMPNSLCYEPPVMDEDAVIVDLRRKHRYFTSAERMATRIETCINDATHPDMIFFVNRNFMKNGRYHKDVQRLGWLVTSTRWYDGNHSGYTYEEFKGFC